MELILLESTLITLTILEILRALAIEHSVMPVAFILAASALTIQYSPPTLNPVSELSFIPTAVTPPESTTAIAFSSLELTLIDIALFSSPVVNTAAFFFIEAELAYVVIPRGEVELSLSLQLSVVELAVDDLVCTLEEAHTLSVRSVHLGLPNVDDLCILEEFGIVKARLYAQNHWRAVFNSQQFLEAQLYSSQLAANKGGFVIKIIQVKLGLFKHLFLRSLIDFELAAHASDEQVEGLIHFFDGFEAAGFNLVEGVLGKEEGLAFSVKFVLLGDVALDDCGVALVEIGEEFQEFLIGLIDASDEIGEFVLLEVLAEGAKAVLHKLVDLNRIVTLVRAVNGQTDGADQPPVATVCVDADKSGVLTMRVAIVGLDEIAETLGELLYVHLHRHQMYNFIMNNSFNCVIAGNAKKLWI